MYCPYCGKENEKDEKYCLYCGRDLSANISNNQNKYVKPKQLNDGILRDPLGYEDLGFGYVGYLLIGLIFYFGQSIVGSLFSLIITALVSAFNAEPHLTNINLFSNLLAGAVCVVGFLIIIRKQAKPLLKKFVDKKTWTKAFMYFGIIYACIIVYSIFMTLFNIESSSANQDSIDAMTAMSPLLSGLYVCICAPIIEELTFRFGLFRSLLKFGKKAAFIIVAAIFAGMHLIASIEAGTLLQDLSSLPVYLIGGLSLTFAYMREKDIAVPICVHFIYNTFGFIMGLIA